MNKIKLFFILFSCFFVMQFIGGCAKSLEQRRADITDAFWQKTTTKDSLKAYRYFLSMYPKSKYTLIAEEKIQERLEERAKKISWNDYHENIFLDIKGSSNCSNSYPTNCGIEFIKDTFEILSLNESSKADSTLALYITFRQHSKGASYETIGYRNTGYNVSVDIYFARIITGERFQGKDEYSDGIPNSINKNHRISDPKYSRLDTGGIVLDLLYDYFLQYGEAGKKYFFGKLILGLIKPARSPNSFSVYYEKIYNLDPTWYTRDDAQHLSQEILSQLFLRNSGKCRTIKLLQDIGNNQSFQALLQEFGANSNNQSRFDYYDQLTGKSVTPKKCFLNTFIAIGDFRAIPVILTDWKKANIQISKQLKKASPDRRKYKIYRRDKINEKYSSVLSDITGEDYGANRGKWLQWWKKYLKEHPEVNLPKK